MTEDVSRGDDHPDPEDRELHDVAPDVGDDPAEDAVADREEPRDGDRGGHGDPENGSDHERRRVEDHAGREAPRDQEDRREKPARSASEASLCEFVDRRASNRAQRRQEQRDDEQHGDRESQLVLHPAEAAVRLQRDERRSTDEAHGARLICHDRERESPAAHRSAGEKELLARLLPGRDRHRDGNDRSEVDGEHGVVDAGERLAH